MDTVTRISFADNGQDFTHWDVHPKTGLILDCQPFQYHVWCDGKRHVDLTTAVTGGYLRITDSDDLVKVGVWSGVVKHQIKAVETVPADWLHLKNAGFEFKRPAA